MNFAGKVALVSGASRGIGRAVAQTLAIRGAKVVGTATNESNAEIISAYLGKMGKGLLMNVTDINSIKVMLKTVSTEFGGIDILVNNAGIVRDNLLVSMKEDEWLSTLNTNLTSIFFLSKAVIRPMIKKRLGRIINIGSVIGSTGNIGQTNYAATKAGLIGFSKSLAREVASRGITVNVVAPGFIDTDMAHVLRKNQFDNIISKIPTGRLGRSQDIANAVVFLASDEAAYITGETLHVNGGLYMV
ncbi:3-oxoacyl-ACP reductase FabG [Candidatus Pantoea carbekii]|uniref:3-oxoacyl-[acyl-carrier-protein] reductase n=1 Tax=Candidatus Pantoea carbekii TaxID=1235990 RepID=U3U9R5_9GAMM|nr:3-oxoacyl-ACP reductase FabG [Candidatus Pantoea carbekii]AKC32132.1 3-oxoacyl-ACP reductase [Candidatus Pantoea carbekii]BAO00658.1 3-ketoacyl-(acyl-carrier-protein) reductase [Candidatus Pantoea carbekii]